MVQRGLALAAALVFTTACGAGVPEAPEASAVISKAIVSTTLQRTVPAISYCMKADPGFSFAIMSQPDLVATFENLPSKTPLYDAVTAGAVHVGLKEFPFDPNGRSPDPRCDAMHRQAKEGGYARNQIRLALVWTELTPKGTEAGVRLGAPIDVATRDVVSVTNMRPDRGAAAVTYTWKWTPTTLGTAVGYTPDAPKDATARLKHADSGWVVEDAGVKR